jgi:hypothetical protein
VITVNSLNVKGILQTIKQSLDDETNNKGRGNPYSIRRHFVVRRNKGNGVEVNRNSLSALFNFR